MKLYHINHDHYNRSHLSRHSIIGHSASVVRLPWILLPNRRYMLGCLCAICQNVVLLLRFANMIFGSKYYASQLFRAINLFILWNRQHGNPREKNVVSDFKKITFHVPITLFGRNSFVYQTTTMPLRYEVLMW